ncbi:HNH endonuclease signature motif containing protein [Aspergillus novofumigatus IBT 16806]|uniref:HNH nuclease domain-containing protein n=1 Tax=Aspergillus novofumigatus (strain IBT 16806) TaxID=1392255 RepID=A0A2I1CLY2_ASPN1|nr:uncharacterized protein P174DRAFT_447239 [Aspergillus novofumigatus IBT 16806]PKX98640.1 hypothetical protein P174DRAFT_447239 [Aspergillus novofumigatus IBT 16806]
MASEMRVIVSGGISAELHEKRRQALIDQLNLALGGAAECAQGVWAALWLCSIEKLEEYVQHIKQSPDSLIVTSLHTTAVVTDIVKPWLTSRVKKTVASSVPGTPVGGAASPASPSIPTTTSPTTPNPKRRRLHLDTNFSSSGPNSPRSATAQRAALERDGERCVITNRRGCTQSAHIYPYSLRDGVGPKCARFWDALSMFWPPSTIEEWKADVFGGSNTEFCSNRITLSADVHIYRGKGLFALKPVSMSEDEKTLQLEFHWLRPVQQSSSTVLLSDKPSLEESLNGIDKDIALYNSEGRLVSSGDKIWMKTDDPLDRPLPSVKLLALQWALQRLASLSGAAEAVDVLLDSDDEDNDDMVRLYDSEEDYSKVDDMFDDSASTKTTNRLASCDTETTPAVQGV